VLSDQGRELLFFALRHRISNELGSICQSTVIGEPMNGTREP
jgi:hypothetical protein